MYYAGPYSHKQGGDIGEYDTQGILGFSDHKVVGFKAMNRAQSKLIILHFRITDFELFEDFLSIVPWDRVLEGRGLKETWLIFRVTSSKLRSDTSQ